MNLELSHAFKFMIERNSELVVVGVELFVAGKNLFQLTDTDEVQAGGSCEQYFYSSFLTKECRSQRHYSAVLHLRIPSGSLDDQTSRTALRTHIECPIFAVQIEKRSLTKFSAVSLKPTLADHFCFAVKLARSCHFSPFKCSTISARTTCRYRSDLSADVKYPRRLPYKLHVSPIKSLLTGEHA